MDPANDDGVWRWRLEDGGAIVCILLSWLLQLYVLPFLEEVNLGVNVRLPSGGLRLRHDILLRVLH